MIKIKFAYLLAHRVQCHPLIFRYNCDKRQCLPDQMFDQRPNLCTLPHILCVSYEQNLLKVNEKTKL